VARRLYGYLKRLGLHKNLRQVAKATGIDMDALQRLSTGTPKVETLEKISEYVEALAREGSARPAVKTPIGRDS